MEDLSLVLWRERELLERLLYRLEVEKLVLASGSTRWLAAAAREVETALEAVHETEVLRAVAADEAAASVGMAANPSLRALAEAVREPWRSILSDHRKAFVSYTQDLIEIASTNRELLTAGQRAARELLVRLAEQAEDRARDGGAVTSEPRRHLVDWTL